MQYGHVPTGKGKMQFYKGKGCATCNFTGMKGRVAIYEVMPVGEELRSGDSQECCRPPSCGQSRETAGYESLCGRPGS